LHTSDFIITLTHTQQVAKHTFPFVDTISINFCFVTTAGYFWTNLKHWNYSAAGHICIQTCTPCPKISDTPCFKHA